MTTEDNNKEARILDLKRRAVELKRNGDLDGAKQLLAQARQTEFENASVEDFIDDPKKLQQLALVLKNKGDIDGARMALLKAKQVKQEQEQEQERQSGEKAAAADTNVPATTTTTTTTPALVEKEEKASEGNKVDVVKEEGSNKVSEDHDENDVVGEDDEALLAELTNDGGGSDADIELDLTQIAYSIEEMQDEEMMVEFKLGGMPTPSDKEYQAKILECKKTALRHKQGGDLKQALEYLKQGKQLEKVRVALSHMIEGQLGLRMNDDDDGWIEELNEEEARLMQEAYFGTVQKGLGQDDDEAAAADVVGGGKTTLDLEDLDSMDASTLMDLLDMGVVSIPSVADISVQAQEKKSEAMQYKTSGDIEKAKVALIEFKRLQAHATKLEGMLHEIEKVKQKGGVSGIASGEGVSDEALEALLNGGGGGGNEAASGGGGTSKMQQQAPPAKPQVKPMTAEELKQEAVRLRNANNMAEATKVFKLYKEALQKEAQAAEMKQREEIVSQLQKEIAVAQKQQYLYKFYQQFVDDKVGSELLGRWAEYVVQCSNVIKVIRQKGTKAISISHQKSNLLLELDDNVDSFVRLGAEPTDERLEVGIMHARNLNDNKHFQKALKKKNKNKQEQGGIRVDVAIQLPPSEQESDRSIELTFQSSSLSSSTEESGGQGAYQFTGSSQYVDLPVRGDSRFAKKILQRMERRRVQFAVYYVPSLEAKPNQQKGGWFWSNSNKDTTGGEDGDCDSDNVLLGKAVIDLKELLSNNCISGDFPLTSGGATRDAGGMIGLCLRTGVPFDPASFLAKQQEETSSPKKSRKVMTPYNAMSFTPSSK